ncbi:MAG: glycoside hydrolase family 31 protein [Chloroflexota bacterium]|nr:glycoside hydrolase family 31 protein [Chloroflexota bacterium]
MDHTTPGSLERYEQDERGLNLFFERGRMRVSPVFEGGVRVRFTLTDEFAPRRSWDVALPDEEMETAQFSVEESGDTLTLVAAPLSIKVSRADGRVGFIDSSGIEFASDISPINWGEEGLGWATRGMAAHLEELRAGLEGQDENLRKRALTEVRVRKTLDEREVLYGFGQRIGLLDRRGRNLTNWTIDPAFGHGRAHDNMYQAHPTFLALRPELAWGCFLHSTWYSRFDAGNSNWSELEMATFGGELDYYIFHGPTPAEVLEKLTRLTGRPFLPPLWALGYHQSRWGYMNQDDIREVGRGFHDREIPLDVIHFDIDYMRGYRDFTWDPERFRDPKALIAELGERGVRAVTIIDPGVKEDVNNGYETADDGMKKDVFIRNPDGTPFVGYVWPDAALFPDFTRPEVREWWGGWHQGHVNAGVAGIWNDMNEPAIFDRPFSEGFSEQKPMPLGTSQGGEGERTVHAETHNLYGLLMSRATHEGLSRLRPDTRPWVLTRSAYTGIQRYAAAWMGDNNSWWEHLEASLPQLASMGVSGVPHVGVDVGGFFDNASAELFARWILLGTFYPFMRTHTAMGTNRQEPWSLGAEVEEISRRAIRLRYRLLPYLYTLAHEAHRTGAPILRPMGYDFPNDTATYHLHDQVMVGPHLLVAPIYSPGRENRIVYLPAGRWYDFWTGKAIEGPTPFTAHAPMDRIPVFIRGGAVLPLGNERRTTSEPLTELTLQVYPAEESAWTITEDDGETLAYQRGETAETSMHVSEADGRVTVRLEARRGPYQPHPRMLSLLVHTPGRPTSVTFDGARRDDWTWDEERGAVALSWEDDGQAHEVATQS